MALLIALLAGAAVFLLAAPARAPSPRTPDPWQVWPGQGPAATPERRYGWLTRRLADFLSTTKVGRDLVVAQVALTLEDLAARKLRLTGITLAAALVLALMGRTNLALFALLAGAWAFQGPDLEIARKAAHRRDAVQKDLPFCLFTLAVLAEAGLQLLPALEHYCNQARSVLADEMKRALAEIRLGQTPVLAFLNLAQDLDVRDFTFFVGAMVQTLEKGSDGLSATLRMQAETAWDKRRRSAQEMGAKASVRLFLPLILFVLPAILAIAAGPAAFNLASQFLQ
jgi:tight adherence protein C